MKFGVTDVFTCSYLPDKEERLLVFVSQHNENTAEDYELMLENGFRRSGEQIYRPHCPACNACQSLRIPVKHFQLSQSQKRVLKKNADVRCLLSREDKPEYYELYEEYINSRHTDGSMYPPSEEQYRHFINGGWSSPLFLEFKLDDQLIAVAVTDELNHSLSALYTFFDPTFEQRSLGTLAILAQIEKTKELNKRFLYLGYQIDSCSKMNYKAKFFPNERFIQQSWKRFQKNT